MKRLLLLAVLCLTACSAPIDETPGSGPMASPATAARQTSSFAPITAPTRTAASTTIEPTLLPTGTRIEPLITSTGQLVALGWSADSEWFVYRDFATSYDYLYNLATGETCPLAEAPQPGIQVLDHVAWEWLADNRLMVVSADGVMITKPCAEPGKNISRVFARQPSGISTASADRSVFVFFSLRDDLYKDLYLYDTLDGSVWSMPSDVGGLDTGFSWSPDLTYLAMMGLIDPLNLPHKGRVWVLDIASGEIVRMVNIDLWNQDAPYLGPAWIDETQFVVRRTLDRGPLLVTMGGGVTPIPAQIFGTSRQNQECDEQACLMHTSILTAGAVDRGQHLVWEGPYRELYHAETGEVEAIDFSGEIRFSPGGKWMLIWNRTLEPSLYLRPVDPPRTAPIPVPVEGRFSTQLSFSPFDWSPDSEYFAVAAEAERYIALYRVPDAAEVGRWWAADYTLGAPGQWSLNYEWMASGVWSPNSQYLLVTGSGPGSALFLIRKP